MRIENIVFEGSVIELPTPVQISEEEYGRFDLSDKDGGVKLGLFVLCKSLQKLKDRGAFDGYADDIEE